MRVTFVHIGRENVGIEYLSSVLKQAGHETCLALDQGLFGPNDNVLCVPFLERRFSQDRQVVRKVLRSNPDLIAFSVYTNTYQWSRRMAAALRRHVDAPIVFGGVHSTLVPDEVMQNPFVDFAVVGEGEDALLELVERRARKCADIRNLWYRDGDEVKSNPVRPPIPDLDALPLPDKGLFERDVNFGDDYLILTARGCRFSCSYCCESFMNRLYKRRYFRRRGVDSVMQELTIMQARYGYREVMFNDSIFFTDREWLGELLARFKEEIRVPFRCFGQSRYLDEEIAGMLKAAGCYAIEFGVQTTNDTIRRSVLNRGDTMEHVRRAVGICDELDLSYDIDHMFGLPDESPVDHADAARFYLGLKCLNRLKCHRLTYFPNLRITEIGRDRGILDEGDIEDIRTGRVGDFFHVDSVQDEELRRLNESIQVLFKMLPLLSPRRLEYLLAHERHRKLRRIPGLLVALAQILVAIKNRDYRFLLYLKYYPLRIRRAVFSGRDALTGDAPALLATEPQLQRAE
ncbi:MAG: radical SAM protein [Armatimonadota bacterium]|jgi:hypothetical protein